MDFETFKQFVNIMKSSPKVKGSDSKLFTLNGFYTYLTGKQALTHKRKEESKPFRKWLLTEARPFMRTITEEQWRELGLNPMIGRDGFVQVFSVKMQREGNNYE